MSAPRRGEVWFSRLDPVQGHEQARTRPVVIPSTDIVYAAAGIVTIVPVTSRKRPIRTRVEMRPPEGGLTVVSYVICEQPRTISAARLTTLLGAASPATMRTLSEIVRMLLGL